MDQLFPPSVLEADLEKIKKELLERFGSNLVCLILYGSWVKGTAREDSDVDLAAVFKTLDAETRKALLELEMKERQRKITVVSADVDGFAQEKVPLYTAVKKEGVILYGKVDLSLNPEPPERKYKDFFRRSCQFESEKVRMAEDFVDHELLTGAIELCYIASKHTIQAALAMKGKGYSSKVAILLPLAETYWGKGVTDPFKALFALYVKATYGMEVPFVDEARNAISWAKKVLVLYRLDQESFPE